MTQLNVAGRTSDLRRFGLRALIGVAFAGLLAACTSSAVRSPVPVTLSSQVTTLDIPYARFWGDEIPENFDGMVEKKYAQTKSARPELFKPGARPTVSFLTISGGGSDGAFGAGLLNGWSENGTRPEFDIVTGVSTGALSAPFAFLGSRYDPILKEVYTQYGTEDLVEGQALRGLLGGSSLASNKLLARMIAKYITPSFMAEVAREHNRGRRLLIGTTNLDAQRPVIWDMGEIAASGKPGAIQLFRSILLASSAIPGVFPPVFISVNANGKTFQEMHVDGGTTQQVFLLPGQIQEASLQKKYKIRSRRRVYIIRNGRISPENKAVEASTLSIASRSVDTLIKNQGIGDLFRMYEFSKRNRIKYQLSYIPADFPATSTEAFDKVYMNKLYNLGYRLGVQGYRWRDKPPGSGKP